MRRWLLPAGVYVAITIALTYPLLLHFGSAFPHDSGDPALNTWILWWNAQRIPLTESWWNAPMFFPMTGAMALSEVLIGLLPVSAPVQWLTGNPLTAYNAAFVLSFVLSSLAAYALALELTGRRDAALLAGIACAYAPYRMGQQAHLQVLSYYWTPIALLGLHRYVRSRDWRWLVLFAAGWAMQSLSNGYALFHVSILVAFWVVWFARPWRIAAPIVGAWLCAMLPIVPLLLKYRDVHSSLHLVRDINEIKRFGMDVSDILRAPSEVALWGSHLWPARPETASFPGATVLVVGLVWLAVTWLRRPEAPQRRTRDRTIFIALSAAAALVALSTFVVGPWAIGPLTVGDFHKPFSLAVLFRLIAILRGPWARRAWREHSVVGFYVMTMIAMYVLALGPEPRLFGRPILYEPPYAWLMRLPGFDTLRVPARFVMLAALCQSLLLAFAMARWSLRPSARRVAMVLVGIGLLADGWGPLRVAPAPAPGPEWQNVSAVIELPPDPGRSGDFSALYRSMFHGRPIVNGYSGYFPPHYLPLAFAIRDHQYSALQEVAVGRPLGVAVNRAASDASTAEAVVGTMAGVTRGPAPGGWSTFVLRANPPPSARLGPELAISSVSASRHLEDIGRLSDRRVETAWGTGVNQTGDEEVLVDLGSVQSIGGIVLSMGAYSFGFPRELEIDSSADKATWAPVWGGPTAVPAVHAAIRDPGTVPLTIDLGLVSARYVRLRQTGSEPGIPWWIAELSVFAPANAAGSR